MSTNFHIALRLTALLMGAVLLGGITGLSELLAAQTELPTSVSDSTINGTQIRRQGVGAGLALGVGAPLEAPTAGASKAIGVSYDFWLGLSVSDKVVLGGHASTWWRKEDELTRRTAVFGPRVSWFPLSWLGLRSSLVYGELRTRERQPRGEMVRNDKGLGFTLGLTVEPLQLGGFRATVAIDWVRLQWLKYAPDEPGEPNHPHRLAFRIGLAAY